MPPRLAHRKSRMGCVRCKSRRVKCTEERPSCAACLRHSLPCHYPQEKSHLRVPSDSHAVPNTPTSNASSVVGPASPYTLEGDIDALDSEHFQRRLLELRLLHHYVTVLARTLPAAKGKSHTIKPDGLKEVYVVDTVQLAFEFPFLLNTIFAISSLHKTQPQSTVRAADNDAAAEEATDPLGVPAKTTLQTPLEVAEYARAHRIYLNRAIRQQREVLMELSPTNADAVCLNSVLLSIIALKLLPNEPNPAYEPPLQWLQMAHAISTVIRASQPFLPPNSAMRRMMTLNDPDFTDKDAIFNFEHIPPFKAILDYPEQFYPDEEESLTYNLAVSYMAAIYRAIQNRDPYRQIARRIMSLGPVLPKHFVELVEQRRPKALVILAYMMSMTKYVDDYWFFYGTADHDVHGIQSILPNEWQWAMEWPLGMLKTLAEPQYRNLEA